MIASRRHEVVKVYASDTEGLDLLLIGKLVVAVNSGEEAEVGFAARIVLEQTIKGLRFKHYEAWSVSYFGCLRGLGTKETNEHMNRTKHLLKRY